MLVDKPRERDRLLCNVRLDLMGYYSKWVLWKCPALENRDSGGLLGESRLCRGHDHHAN